MEVSLRDVANRSGVSVGTVSNVLNRPETVKLETRERVLGVISELGYVPNGAARQLRAGQSQVIALVVLDVRNPFFTDVARGAEREAAQHGLSVLLANSDQTPEREAASLNLFERQRVLGLLVSPLGEDLARLRSLRERGIPVILVDRGANDTSFSSVSVDDMAGGTMAAEHVLTNGRRRLAFVGGQVAIRQVADRLAGARAAVQRVPGATIEHIESDGLSLDEGRRVGAIVRARVAAGEIDAVLSANDLIAIGVQQAVLGGEDAPSIPRDVALVGYDDISFAAAAVVPITSVRQPREEIGAMAVRLLMEGREDRGAPARQVVFQPELVVRESSV